MKRSVMIFLTAFLFLVGTADVLAQYGPYGPYGVPVTPSILVDKMVGNPVGVEKGGTPSVQYVDNLGATDYRFSPGQEIFFKVKVKNTTEEALEDVTVEDFVPSYLEPVEGPGEFDEISRIITIEAGDFAIDEEKVYVFKMQIYPQDKLPADKGLFCLINKAKGYTNQVSDEDSSQFCIEKEVLGAVEVPAAGAEFGLALLFGQLTTLGAGLYLRRRTG